LDAKLPVGDAKQNESGVKAPQSKWRKGAAALWSAALYRRFGFFLREPAPPCRFEKWKEKRGQNGVILECLAKVGKKATSGTVITTKSVPEAGLPESF